MTCRPPPRPGERPSQDYLGRGWAFPVRWDPGDPASLDAAPGVRLAQGEDDVRQAIWILLKTSLGERVMRPEFGAGIDRYVFAPRSKETAFRLQSDVERVLVRWEPRIQLDLVVAEPSPDDEGRMDVHIEYRLDPHRRSRSLVFPFYLEETEEE